MVKYINKKFTAFLPQFDLEYLVISISLFGIKGIAGKNWYPYFSLTIWQIQIYNERNPTIACNNPAECLTTPYVPNPSPKHLKIKKAVVASHCKR